MSTLDALISGGGYLYSPTGGPGTVESISQQPLGSATSFGLPQWISKGVYIMSKNIALNSGAGYPQGWDFAKYGTWSHNIGTGAVDAGTAAAIGDYLKNYQPGTDPWIDATLGMKPAPSPTDYVYTGETAANLLALEQTKNEQNLSAQQLAFKQYQFEAELALSRQASSSRISSGVGSGGGGSSSLVAALQGASSRGSAGSSSGLGSELAFQAAMNAEQLAYLQAKHQLELSYLREKSSIDSVQFQAEQAYRNALLNIQQQQLDLDKTLGLGGLDLQRQQLEQQQSQFEQSNQLDRARTITAALTSGNPFISDFTIRGLAEPKGTPVDIFTGQVSGPQTTYSELQQQQVPAFAPFLQGAPLPGVPAPTPGGEQPAMQHGGGTTARQFIVGDHNMGLPNPEMVQIENPGPNTRAHVTPLNQAVANLPNLPHYASGTEVAGGNVLPPPITPPPPPEYNLNGTEYAQALGQTTAGGLQSTTPPISSYSDGGIQAASNFPMTAAEKRAAGWVYNGQTLVPQAQSPDLLQFLANSPVDLAGRPVYQSFNAGSEDSPFNVLQRTADQIRANRGEIGLDQYGQYNGGRNYAGVQKSYQTVDPYSEGYADPRAFLPQWSLDQGATQQFDPRLAGFAPPRPPTSQAEADLYGGITNAPGVEAAIPGTEVVPGGNANLDPNGQILGPANAGGFRAVLGTGRYEVPGGYFDVQSGDFVDSRGQPWRFNPVSREYTPLAPQGVTVLQNSRDFFALDPAERAKITGGLSAYAVGPNVLPGMGNFVDYTQGLAPGEMPAPPGGNPLTRSQFDTLSPQDQRTLLSGGVLPNNWGLDLGGGYTGSTLGENSTLFSLRPQYTRSQLGGDIFANDFLDEQTFRSLFPREAGNLGLGPVVRGYEDAPIPVFAIRRQYEKRQQEIANSIAAMNAQLGTNIAVPNIIPSDIILRQIANNARRDEFGHIPQFQTGTDPIYPSYTDWLKGGSTGYTGPNRVASRSDYQRLVSSGGIQPINTTPPAPTPVPAPPAPAPAPAPVQEPAPLPSLPTVPVYEQTPAATTSPGTTTSPETVSTITFGPEAFAQSPTFQYLSGGISPGDYFGLGNQPIPAPSLGIDLPAPGSIQYSRLADIINSGGGQLLAQMLQAGNISLDQLLGLVGYRAPLGSAVESSLIRTG